ncbi:BMA-NPP-6, isoform e [Aphelenchoides besseyi]|nr:BMA-NPP-6, isoform e [Aphelenchoides besseyi]
MRSFNGAEISFSYTNFPDSPVRSFALAELPETGGSFSFPDDGFGFYNRVLFWRTEGSRIHFNEISATRDVNDPSLCIDLRPSMIIPGSSISFHRGILVIIIPTHFALHRLSIRIGGDGERNSSNRSVLSYFPRDDEFANYYDHYYMPNGITISRVAISADYRGDTLALVANNKAQLSVVRMPFFYSSARGSMISRFFVKSTEPALAVAMSTFNGQLYAFSVQSDGKLRFWSAQDGLFKGHYALVDALRTDAAFDVEDVQLKTFTTNDTNVVAVKIQLMKKVRFLFFSVRAEDFVKLTSCDLYSTGVVDFECVPSTVASNQILLWAITRESYEDNEHTDAMFQPYLMHRCTVDLNGLNSSTWDAIDPGMPDPIFDKLLFAETTTKSIKQRVFDGDTYSFEVVLRAVQTVCKCPTITLPYRDWSALSVYTESFVQTGQFKQMYLSDQDRGLLLSSNVDQALLCAAYDRFWLDVQKCCNQFQETSLNPVAIWHSSALGLIGTIQQCRFTVYVPPDYEMRSMLSTNSQVADTLFDVARDYKVDMTNNQSLIKTDMDVVCKIIEKFADSHADQSDIKLDRLKSSYLNSAFSTAMLATALRYRVLGRLCFAKIVSLLTKLVPAAFAKAVRFKLSNGITEFSSRNSNAGRTSRLNTIAQAFFKSGLISINKTGEFIDEDMDDENREITKRNDNFGESEFSSFVSNALESAMIALWPESKSLVIPRFLAESKHYDALNDYCKHNEPFLTELSAAFHFFRGIALVGLGEPSAAASFFEEASQGIVSKDEPLNRVLYHYTKQEPPYEHTLTDFFCVVMNIYKTQQTQTEYVIRTGIFALSFAAEDDPLRVSFQYVATEQYFEAIRVLHLNPSMTSQENCLRNLIAILCDKGKTKSLVTLHYGKLTDQVAELLETKCKAMPPMNDSGFFETVYAFYIHRYNYEAAARVMYNLCWRLRWEAQSREVLEKRLRVLSCVCQTIQMLPPNHSIEFDLRGLSSNGETQNQNNQENTSQMDDSQAVQLHLQNVCKDDLYNEYLLLEARMALVDTGGFPEGPKLETSEVYAAAVQHKLYDLAFILQNNEEPLQPHWKLLVALVDLSLKHNSADVRVLHPILNLLLERSLPIPKWLEKRYSKVNARYFLHQLIEFDELSYAFTVLNSHLEKLVKQKLTSKDLYSIPLVQANALLSFATETEPNHSELSTSTSNNVRRINIADYCDPLVSKPLKKNATVQNEFFGVYCLISRNEKPQFKEEKLPFPIEIPKHMKTEDGLVQKVYTVVPQQLTDYTLMGNCNLCSGRIRQLNEFLECLADECRSQYHVRCWAESGLNDAARAHIYCFPLTVQCKVCKSEHLWGDLIRRQRCIVAVEAAKPNYDNAKLADGMIPKQIQQI